MRALAILLLLTLASCQMPLRTGEAMTAAEFSTAIDQLELTPKRAADWLDTNERTVQRYRDGEWPVPHLTELLLMELLLH